MAENVVAVVNPDGSALNGGRGAGPEMVVAVQNLDGSPVRVGLENYVPADQGYITWSYDPIFAGTTWNATASSVNGIIFLQQIPVFTTKLNSGIEWGLSSSGDSGSATAGNFLGLYTASGNQVAVSADIGTVLTSQTGPIATPWVTPVTITNGYYYVALVMNGTWSSKVPTWKATGGGSTTNSRLSAPNYRLANMLTGQTSLPSTLNFANQTTTAITGGAMSAWFGLY